MKYLKYLRYLLLHKWFVFIECVKLGIWWRGLVHDLSKFLPSEFFPYAHYFYSLILSKSEPGYFQSENVKNVQFKRAWLLHQKRNPHHWQWWVLRNDDDSVAEILEMSDAYRREMLADWRGAGRAQGYGDNVREWYQKNKKYICLHPRTRAWIEEQIGAWSSP